jgi:hypothetical protein
MAWYIWAWIGKTLIETAVAHCFGYQSPEVNDVR